MQHLFSTYNFVGFGFRLPFWPRWYCRAGWWVGKPRPFFRVLDRFGLGWQLDLWRVSISYNV